MQHYVNIFFSVVTPYYLVLIFIFFCYNQWNTNYEPASSSSVGSKLLFSNFALLSFICDARFRVWNPECCCCCCYILNFYWVRANVNCSEKDKWITEKLILLYVVYSCFKENTDFDTRFLSQTEDIWCLYAIPRHVNLRVT